MGNCCSGQTADIHGDIKSLDQDNLNRRITMDQIALIIKVQAAFRGYITRKKIRVAQVNMGMHHQYDPYEGMAGGENDDYDNPKVLVSTVFIFQTTTQRMWWNSPQFWH